MLINNILCPTDFSDPARYAFDAACWLAQQHGSRVTVMHVGSPPANHAEEVDRRLDNDYYDALWQALHRHQAPEGIDVKYRLEEGDAAKEIIRIAEESGCDLIVMGTAGRGALLKLVLGSVAAQVVRHAPCPVLTLRTPFTAA